MAKKKILIVVPPYNFHDHEYETCRRHWESRGYKVTVASLERVTARGEQDTAVPVDIAVRDVKQYDYDAIVFIGGEGARLLFDDDKVRELAKDAKYKVLGATGNATILLALAGVADGKKVTGPPESAGWLARGKGSYTGQPVQVDEKLVTVQDTPFVHEFATAVVRVLEK